MDKWKKIIDEINAKTLQSRTWNSDQRNLLKILDAARIWDIDPANAQHASLSNLRTIIKPAKAAIKGNDRAKLDALFKSAAELTTVELRQHIGIRSPEEVGFEKVIRKGQVFYQLALTPQQFERMRVSSKPYYIFREHRKNKDK